MLENSVNFSRREIALAIGQIAVGAVIVALLFGLVGSLVVGFWVSLIFGAILGSAASAYYVDQAGPRLLRSIRAQAVVVDAEPRLENIVDGLCASSGLPLPELAVLATPSANCLTVGKSPDTTTLVVTQGLLDQLSRMELEGVIARQLAQVKSGETRLGTAMMPLASVASALGFYGAVVQRVLPYRFDVIADLDGVELTRYPPGLFGALEKVRNDSEVPGVPSSSAHLWLSSPFADQPGRAAHSSMDERIDILQEL